MDDLPPPPPYTPYDHTTSVSSSAPSPALLASTAGHSSAPETHTTLPGYSSETETLYVSGAPYFSIRPPTCPPPSTVIQHRITILPNSSPENVSFPGTEFVRRGINQYDWSTFLNHLFPLHAGGGGSVGEEKSRNSKRPTQQNRGSASTPSGPVEISRRRTILAAVEEWNLHFFASRGVRIIAEIQPMAPCSTTDIDARPFGGETALYKAISASDVSTVQLLLSKGANPNAKAYGGEPAVYRALKKICSGSSEDPEKLRADREILSLLLAYGADVNANPPGSTTPLHVAVSNCNRELAELLLQYGADVNAKPRWGETPLFAAAAKGDVAMVRMLIAAGANVDDSPAGRETALHGAVGRGDREVFEALLAAGASLGEKHWSGGSPVQVAARKGDQQMVRRLLEHGAKVDESSAGSHTALGEATLKGDVELVKLCLEFGADPGKQKWGLESPLASAVGIGNQEIIRLMLGAVGGADDIAAQARKIAAEKGHLEVLASLSSKDPGR